MGGIHECLRHQMREAVNRITILQDLEVFSFSSLESAPEELSRY